MTSPQIQNDPIYSLPFLYINGMVISNDVSTPNTVLDISAGQCRDSNDIMDICLGASNPNLEGETVVSPLLLNAAINGANGLDTGSLAASTMYAIYMIGDSRYYQPVASIMTLASNSVPLLPFGYDSYRLIGYWATDGSSHFLAGYMAQVTSGSTRSFVYDAPQATAVTAGASTTYAAVSLASLVPNLNNLLVSIQSNFNANAAADVLNLQGANSAGDAVTIIAAVAGATSHVVSVDNVLAQLVAGVPKINYKVSSGSDAVALNVAGFTFGL